MIAKLAASLLTVGALMLPIAAHAADADIDRTSPGVFVKDSVITAKIKARLAEEKLSSLVKIRVDTDANGKVVMRGTAANQEAADKAVSIARAVEGVTSVRSSIRVAGAGSGSRAMHSTPGSGEKRVEARISDMHSRLHITQAQEAQWTKLADEMRANAKAIDALAESRYANAKTMTAVDDLKSYTDIANAHADGLKKFTPIFADLYASMSDAQKKDADAMFQHGGRGMSKHH